METSQEMSASTFDTNPAVVASPDSTTPISEANIKELAEKLLGSAGAVGSENVIPTDAAEAVDERKAFCGIDFGSFKSVVASSTAATPHAVDVDVNFLSNRSSPSVVSFERRVRNMGEAAEDRVTTAGDNTITQLVSLFATTSQCVDLQTCSPEFIITSGCHTLSSLQKRMPWRLRGRPIVSTSATSASGDVTFDVDFNGETLNIALHHISAYFLRSCLNFCLKSRGLLQTPHQSQVTIAAPSHINDTAASAIADSCHVGGISNFSILRQSDALRNLWVARNLPSVKNGSLEKALFAAAAAVNDNNENTPSSSTGKQPCVDRCVIVGIVDAGFSQTSVQFVKVTPAAAAGGQQEQGEEQKGGGETKVEVLAHMCDGQLGTAEMMDVVIRETCRRLEAAHKHVVDLSSRKAWRLANQCTKLVKDLSGLPSSSIELEAFVDEATDFKTNFSREEFETLCGSIQERFRSIFSSALSKAKETLSLEDFTSLTSPCCIEGDKASPLFCGVELVGGGTRVPWLQNIVEELIGGGSWRLRRTMDSSAAAATGAALFGAGEKWVEAVYTTETGLKGDGSMDMQNMMDLEKKIQEVERLEILRREKYNDFESFILSMRSALSNRQTLFGPWRAAVTTEVQKADDWLMDQDIEETTMETYAEKYSSLQTTLREICPAYFEALETEKADKEAALEAANRAARAEGGVDEKEDHDNRKLPTGQRLKLAKKNKDEGNELFKGGSLEFAAQRYIKALSHTSKIFDASPQDTEEASAVKYACHLNLAAVYLRLNTEVSFKKCVASSTAALEIDEKSVKALFRRAAAHEKLKDFEKAMTDLKQASAVAEGNDADVNKAIERVQKYIDFQEAKAKKMYARMFSGKTD